MFMFQMGEIPIHECLFHNISREMCVTCIMNYPGCGSSCERWCIEVHAHLRTPGMMHCFTPYLQGTHASLLFLGPGIMLPRNQPNRCTSNHNQRSRAGQLWAYRPGISVKCGRVIAIKHANIFVALFTQLSHCTGVNMLCYIVFLAYDRP